MMSRSHNVIFDGYKPVDYQEITFCNFKQSSSIFTSYYNSVEHNVPSFHPWIKFLVTLIQSNILNEMYRNTYRCSSWIGFK